MNISKEHLVICTVSIDAVKNGLYMAIGNDDDWEIVKLKIMFYCKQRALNDASLRYENEILTLENMKIIIDEILYWRKAIKKEIVLYCWFDV